METCDTHCQTCPEQMEEENREIQLTLIYIKMENDSVSGNVAVYVNLL